MKKLTLNILIIFLLFISSYQLTEKEKKEIMDREIIQCIYNITNSCGSLYNNPNLNIDYKNKRCLGYCHEFLHTKLQQTMKIFNIPHSDFLKIAKKLQERWNNRNALSKILHIDFITEYKIKVNETKLNNTLIDKASKIASEIKHYSTHVTTYCLKQIDIPAKNRCLLGPLKFYLETTFSHYSIFTVQYIIDIVLDLKPETQYEDIGQMIIDIIKKKMDENKKLRRLKEDEDALYDNIVRLFKLFCSLF